MYSAMRKLISKRYYVNSKTAQEKLDVFFAVGRISEEQYTELTLLVGQMYQTEG